MGELGGGDSLGTQRIPPTQRMMSDEERAGKIRALLEERHGYEQRGDTVGVSDVDTQLRLLGAEGTPKAQRAAKRTDDPT